MHGAPTLCPTTFFSGSWTAVVDSDPDCRLIISGRGQEPADVTPTRVASDAYGFAVGELVPQGTHVPAGSPHLYATTSAPQPHPDWTPFLMPTSDSG